MMTALLTGASWYAFRQESLLSPSAWVTLLGAYAPLAAWGLWGAHRRGELLGWVRPRSGDITRGFIAAAVIFGLAYLGSVWLAPQKSPQEAWMAQIYAYVGSPDDWHAARGWLALWVFAVSAMEEIVWRGHIRTLIREELGAGRAWFWVALLHGVTVAPSVFAFRAEKAGYNPFIVMLALAMGLALGIVVSRSSGRLWPAIFGHFLSVWTLLSVFRLWGRGV